MSRRILCQPCGDKWKPHPRDVQEGWNHRSVHVTIKKPEDHSTTVITDLTTDQLIDVMAGKDSGAGLRKTTALPSILCDTCGEAIPDGTVALAVTMWRDNPIGLWEHEYGTVLPEEAAKLERVLSKGAV